ncbi:MAG: helix-turn-helix transcriptional regulator [Bacteroidia bacterium]
MEKKDKKEINRIRVVLAEKYRTNKWLAKHLKKTPSTVSKWCNNAIQPSLETLLEIANALDVDIKDLLNSSKN